MSVSILNLGNPGERQTGITTLGVAMINGVAIYQREHAWPMFITSDRNTLQWTTHHRGLLNGLGTWADAVLNQPLVAKPTLAVIDDCNLYTPEKLYRLVATIQRHMSALNCQTQIILLRNPYDLSKVKPCL